MTPSDIRDIADILEELSQRLHAVTRHMLQVGPPSVDLEPITLDGHVNGVAAITALLEQNMWGPTGEARGF